jgi:hypothetical protein
LKPGRSKEPIRDATSGLIKGADQRSYVRGQIKGEIKCKKNHYLGTYLSTYMHRYTYIQKPEWLVNITTDWTPGVHFPAGAKDFSLLRSV